MPFQSEAQVRLCLNCGAEVPLKCSRDFTRKKYCSMSCRAQHLDNLPKGLKGEKSPRWKGGRRIDRQGYVRVWTAEQPDSREHRVVMEQLLGRRLNPSESVHHINGDRQDNRPDNLELWVRPQPTGIRAVDVPHCPTCSCGGG